MYTESLIKLAELVLKNNYFEFNDRFRKQKEDAAIATKFASPYAIIFMAVLEEEILESLLKKTLAMVEVHRCYFHDLASQRK